MPSGTFSVTQFNLQQTLTSGQTFQWGDDETHEFPTEDTETFYTTISEYDSPTDNPEVIRLSQPDSTTISWDATFQAESYIHSRFNLSDDISQILADITARDDTFKTHIKTDSIRLVRDPLHPTILSYICSIQMRVPRIFELTQKLRDTYGSEIDYDGTTYSVTPTPQQMKQSTESELKELGFGYRSEYIATTSHQLLNYYEKFIELPSLSTADAREQLQFFMGVGEKVADCILLYGLGRKEVVPIDTWMKTAAEELYSCTENQQAFFMDLWGEYGGYAQLYLFENIRLNGN